jgi:DNA repair protein RadA/Sms
MKLLNIGKGIKRGTNIVDVNVPEELKHKDQTGLDWIDIALGGGFTPSTAMMLTGDPGCGKTTMLLTIANALTSQGHVVLYNGGEESPYQVKMTCDRLGLNKGFFWGEDVFVQDVVAHAKLLQKKLKPGKRVYLFVDSLQCLDSGKYDTGRVTKNTPVQCCEALVSWAKETFGVVVFINHVTKSGNFAGSNTIKHAVDVHAHFGFDKDKKSDTCGERVLDISKNRFGQKNPPICIEMGMNGRLNPKVVVESEQDEDELEDAAE